MITDEISIFEIENECLTGVCNAERLEHLREIVGRSNTPFVSKNADERIDPKNILPSCKSIFVMAKKYGSKAEDCGNEGDKPSDAVITRLNTPLDYHKRVKQVLQKLADILAREYGEFEFKLLVDSKYLPEKELAQKAGLGFIGKNGLLINERFGSYLNLGLVLTDIEFEKLDILTGRIKDLTKGCGGCDICRKSCTANALENGFENEKCISFLTQKRGELSEIEMETMGANIYGCDICQDVCPYNTEVLANMPFEELKFLQRPKIKTLLECDKDEFDDFYKNTSCYWIGLNTIKRNALIAAGNSGRAEYLPIVEKFLGVEDKNIAKASLWAQKKLKK